MIVLPVNDIDTPSPEKQIQFRIMDELDIDAYCRLFQRVFASAPWNEKWTLERIEENIRKLMHAKGFIGVVAITGHTLVGFITGARLWVFSKVFYCAQLFVDDDARGKGIGNNLMREATTVAKGRGVSTMILLTKSHSKAEQFYRRNDFSPWFSVFRIRDKCILYKKI